MVVLFSVVLALLLAIGSIVVSIGSWYVHARHLQTKVDAAAFAGGGSWGFPCGPDIDGNIEAQARKYLGVHTKADNSPYTTTTLNPQVGKVQGDQIMVALNQADWWRDGSFSAFDWTNPAGSVCQSKILDVKATENDSPLLWGWIPFFPDVKKKARVQIEEVEGLTGLLPIAVRLPQPLSAAAVFYDEEDGSILDLKYFREVCPPVGPLPCIWGIPPGLGQWTTEPGTSGTWAQFEVKATTGVLVATSVRPRCVSTPPADPPCLDVDPTWKGQQVDDFCRQASGTVQCFDANGGGTTQTVQSGVQFIRGYDANTPTGTGPPQLRTAYLDSQSLGCASYFNSSSNPCTARLNVKVDLGALEGMYPNPPGPDIQLPLRASDVQVRYRLVRADGTTFCDYGVNCDLWGSGSGAPTFSTQGNTVSPHLPIAPSSRGNAVAIEVMLRNAVNHSNPNCSGTGFNPNCRWFYTARTVSPSVPPTDAEILAAPIQRSFMGDLDRTGALRWLRLTMDGDCVMTTLDDRIVGGDPDTGVDAASQPAGDERCYIVEMGLGGGMARDQDEPPIALNLGGVISGSSQRALINCDPDINNLKDEILFGCRRPSYAANKFNTTPLCPGHSGFFDYDPPKPAPFQDWPPFTCVLTQPTAAGNQIMQGFNERLFGKPNNPTCPDEDTTGYPPPPDGKAPWTKGRNYWHRDNNAIDDYTFAWDGNTPPPTTADDWGNELRSDDPRLVTLFFTTYDSFTDNGNEVYPIVGFGNFYITGYGRTGPGGWQGGAPDDPCTDGNDGDLWNGNGNEPPPDLDFAKNTTWAWGHFVKDVTPGPFTTGGSGILCNPESSFQPCVAVLVE